MTKCGGLSPKCASGMYAGVDANTAATETNKNTACCTAVATCATMTKTCAPGWKRKTSAATTKCSGGPSTCSTETCCEADVTKCGGLGTITCVASKVRAASKVFGNKAAKEATKLDDCCVAKATCAAAGYTCPAGYKRNKDTTSVCEGQTVYHLDVTKCAVGSTCCEKDVLKCGGLSNPTCASDTSYYEATTAWKNTPATDATKNTACCMAKAKCSAGTCPAGYKMKAGVENTMCPKGAASCAAVPPKGNTCCELDNKKCGGLSFTCPSGTSDECLRSCRMNVGDAAAMKMCKECKNKATKESTKVADCCTAQGTCSAFKLSGTTPAAAVKKTFTGSFSFKMSVAHAKALCTDPKAKDVFAKALASSVGLDASSVKINAIYIDGAKVARRLSEFSLPRRLADSSVKVDYEAITTKTIAKLTSGELSALGSGIKQQAKAVGIDVVIKGSLTATDPVAATEPVSGGASPFPNYAVMSAVFATAIAGSLRL
jgi:hypothetical protein